MANVKISALSAATTIDGTEEVPIVQGGVTVKSTVTNLRGHTILYGTAEPTTEGSDGDFYIRTTTNFIYGPKATGTWPAGTSLVGPTGANGADGNASVVVIGTAVTGNVTPADNEAPKQLHRVTATANVTLNSSLPNGWSASYLRVSTGNVTAVAGTGTPTLLGTVATTTLGDILSIIKTDTAEFVCKVG